MSEQLRTAIVGCGAIAHWHLDAIERAGVPIDGHRRGRSRRASNAQRVADRTGATRVRVARRRARRPAASTPR